jgi:tRNA threonylcarbamoyladenosine biosynthesis protein TsaB
MDARMEQVYWSSFVRDQGAELVTSLSSERVDAPDQVIDGNYTLLAGTGFKAYPQLRARLAIADRVVHEAVLPKASDIALLAEAEFRAGRARPATEAEPVYIRDQVAHVKGS